MADQKGSGIGPDEWITHDIFDDSCGSTLAANFRPLTFGRLLAQVLLRQILLKVAGLGRIHASQPSCSFSYVAEVLLTLIGSRAL